MKTPRSAFATTAGLTFPPVDARFARLDAVPLPELLTLLSDARDAGLDVGAMESRVR